jgi:hypothetical protein
MTRAHSHRCETCKTPVPCDGTLSRNYDGWPEVICDVIHKPYSSVAETVLCESCHAAEVARTAAEEEAEAIADAEAVDFTTVGEGARERVV